MIEVLMVLNALPAAALSELVQRLQAHCEVTSTMGSRLRVGRVAPHALAALRAQAGVLAVVENAADLASIESTAGLSETEWLFASAWVAKGKKTGPRKGAGLDWDAPGFEPPGGPPR